MASKFGAEIHRRLADHQPIDYISLKTGLRPRVIRWHRLRRCQCPVDGPEAQPVMLDRPVSTGPVVLSLAQVESLPWFGQIRYAFIAGMTEQQISDETCLEVEYIRAVIGDGVRAEAERRKTWAVERIQEMAPAKWLKHQEEERQRELFEAARTSIDPELMAEFLTDIIRHQSALLIEFPDFLEWLRQLNQIQIFGVVGSVRSGD